MAPAEEKEAADVRPCGFERRGEELGNVGCVLKAATTTTTTATKPANDGGHNHDCDNKEELKRKPVVERKE